jgi:DNA-binding response OmpR family regulator
VATRIAILAQDLIWSDRLARAVEAAGASPQRTKTAPEFDSALESSDLAIVDMTARAYDPLVAIERARSAGARVFAVGQHDDIELRKRALARGAERVYAYRKLFEDGPATIAGWLGTAAAPAAEAPAAKAPR